MKKSVLAMLTGCAALSLAGFSQTATAPPPPSDHTTPIVSPKDLGGKWLSQQEPKYPFLAKQLHRQGTVVLRATLSKEGKVIKLEVVSSSDSLLDKSALTAIRKWTHTPYLLNGEPTEVETQLTVNYAPRK